jgi:transposase
LRIAIEAGTHSPWASRVLKECGHEVLVANPRKVRLVYANKRKTDEIDAENLARLARLDPKLLYPLKHRSEDSQAPNRPSSARVRRWSVAARSWSTTLGGPSSPSGPAFPNARRGASTRKRPRTSLRALWAALEPILETIGSLTQRICEYDRQLETICQEHYPETDLLRQVEGIGVLTALTFVLTLEDPYRFEKSRSVGAYLGLVPARDQSGDTETLRSASQRKATRC